MYSTATWNVLLIDDDSDDYLITRDMLSELHTRKAKLTWASTYAEGLRLIQGGEPFDVVLVDYDLGAKTGLDLVREIVPARCSFPVILLTGRGSYEVDVEAMEAGVSLYLTKKEVNALLLERSIRYAMQMKEHERILENRAARLQLVSDLAADLLSAYDPVALLDQVSQRLSALVEADVFVHYQLAPDSTYLSLAAIGGYPEAVRAQLQRLEFGQAVCGTVASTCRPMVVQQVQESKDPLTHLIRHLGIQAYACHPLMVHGHLFGTLSFGSRTCDYFDPQTVDLMRTVCDLMAVAFERRETERMRLSAAEQRLISRVDQNQLGYERNQRL